MSRIHRLIVVAGTVLAAAVIVPGPANAESHFHTGVAVQQDLRSPDARDAAGTPYTTSQDLRSPDARDAGRETPVVVRVERNADPGIDWGSIGLGVLISAGLVLSIAGAYALVGRRRGHGPRVA
jgi:hypothetical protein